MISTQMRSVIDRAKRLYVEHLQTAFEAQHWGQFVAIEPESGEYFVADSLDGAIRAASWLVAFNGGLTIPSILEVVADRNATECFARR
jgi:hypothetical protein